MNSKAQFIVPMVVGLLLIAIAIGGTLFVALNPQKGPNDYEVYYDVSQCPLEGYIEFVMAVDETLEGTLVVWEGSVVFVVTDNWDRHIVDTIVKAGHQEYICITAKQTGEIYRCWFWYEPGKEEETRVARFYCDKRAKGWERK